MLGQANCSDASSTCEVITERNGHFKCGRSVFPKKPTVEVSMKYADLLWALDRGEIYTPGTIAYFADESGYIEETDPEKRKNLLLRIRIAMGRLSNNRNMPDEGDGMVTIRGQAPTPGWYGWRWQQSIKRTKG